jgi:endonuclease/exonuclease/phosphatase family metal-dependent hydrolase
MKAFATVYLQVKSLPGKAAIALFSLVSLTISQAQAEQLQFLSFNVLAPVYANPTYYFPSTMPFVQREVRRAKIIEMLDLLRPTADVIALQEVSVDTLDVINGVTYLKEGEYKYFLAALQDEYYGFHTSHDRTYWSKYYDYTDPNAYNAYIDTGVALFIRKSKFTNVDFQDVSLGTGNHMILAEADAPEGKRVRVAAIHFDSDVGGNRNYEFSQALTHMVPDEDVLNFMLGDFNASFEEATLKHDFDESIFADTMLALEETLNIGGINKRTRPSSETYYNAPHFGPIDHVIFEKAKVTPVTTLWTVPANYGIPGYTVNGVLDNRLFIRYPELHGYDWNEETRVNQGMIELGSDHFPVISTLSY